MTMPECVRVADGGATSSRATMHSTPALPPHRRRHGFPLRVRAPHRGARFMGSFSRCASPLLSAPTSRDDGTYDRLSAGMDVDVLDSDVLLTLAAVTVEGFGQSRVGPGELVRLV